MQEKILTTKKRGMAALIILGVLYAVALVLLIAGLAEDNITLGVIGAVYIIVGIVPFAGLKVLKPQEAMVLTLFGKYVGTLKEAGFYYVNPFCSAFIYDSDQKDQS